MEKNQRAQKLFFCYQTTCVIRMMTMLLQPYRLRLKTASATFLQKNVLSTSNRLQLYFKGEQSLTQTCIIPLHKLTEDTYECPLELIDVGSVNNTMMLGFDLFRDQ
jgi:hypothetical protein